MRCEPRAVPVGPVLVTVQRCFLDPNDDFFSSRLMHVRSINSMWTLLSMGQQHVTRGQLLAIKQVIALAPPYGPMKVLKNPRYGPTGSIEVLPHLQYGPMPVLQFLRHGPTRFLHHRR